MTIINQETWNAYIPGEVPEGCTYEQFCAAREAMWKEQDRDDNIASLKECKSLYDYTKHPETKQLMTELMELIIKEIRG